ncbi:MAG: DEAD/DEAH box helicase [Muribaculum sp.]|nr:DEAD/DEAH box helicase [Muribaculaceae bacterium]MCM1080484.1 DEAD/DEAH box helicase [Muribaculum sp.]
MTFEELNLTDDVLDALYDMHFDRCTPIQEQAIPAALSGRDVIAVAQTGTGKTAAFLLPVINELGKRAQSDKVKCLVMTPTRELTMQIDAQMDGFSYYVPISSLAIYGGTDGALFSQQQAALKNGAEVIIATPGRLIAHLQTADIDLSQIEFFILDEADRMLDMGFYDDIMQIVKRLPQKRQTMLFSATMPPKIQKLAKTVLHNPVEIKIAVSRPTEKIDQRAFVCPEQNKTAILRNIFRTVSSERVIVFASSKIKVKDLARELRSNKLIVGEMHSDLDQKTRDEVMHKFRNGHTNILVATDIVARGIDIDNISLVVNYDVPHDAEDYVHRIGRTARAGAGGIAITLVGERDRRKFHDIESFLGYKVKREGNEEERPESAPTKKSNAKRNVPGDQPSEKPASTKRRRFYHKKKTTGKPSPRQPKQ